jgi:hypothetical protein
MTERLNHKLDVSKIQTLEDMKNVLECMDLVASMKGKTYCAAFSTCCCMRKSALEWCSRAIT